MYALDRQRSHAQRGFRRHEHDSVFAIDADTGALLWQTSLLYPAGATTVTMAVQGCGGVTGLNEVGILGTPVIDPTSGTLYVVTKSALSGTYYFYLHALDVTTGPKCSEVPLRSAPPSELNFHGSRTSFSGQLCWNRMAHLHRIRIERLRLERPRAGCSPIVLPLCSN